VTLIELVVSIVLVGIIVATVVYFAYPVRQAGDIAVRAELTDAADNALQRIGREVRLALPNSVRLPCGTLCVEFIPVRTAGRYRAEPSGAGCDAGADATGSDELAFDVADSCFKSIGAVPNPTTIVASDFLVLNNYGSDFPGQDAYATAGTLNRVAISSATEQGGVRQRINFSSSTFNRTLHDSTGKRFYVVTTPVAYVCAGGELRRHAGYSYAQSYTDVAGVLVAGNVGACSFDYVANSIGPQTGLLTLRLTLSKARSGGPTDLETVTLYYSVHVNNVP
jgi:MSHA biogenesis protein MshO